MAVLVTRPVPGNERTARALQERGYDVLLAPVLWTQALPVNLEMADVTAIAVTSANTLHLIADHPARGGLLELPLFAVGEHTATIAKAMGFRDVRTAAGDVDALIVLIASQRLAGVLLYLAGEDITRDLEAALRPAGIIVRTETVYRMVPAPALAEAAALALRQGRIDAVLHFSRRSAHTFLDLVSDGELRAAALAVPHCCLSPAVAEVLRASGAHLVIASAEPREQSLLEALDDTLQRRH